MFCCTDSELALTKRFEGAYARSKQPVMQAIERHVCGCDYGGNSWTTRKQADALIGLLGLGAGTNLIDLGAGTGWPGLYLAEKSACTVTLVDLPEIGLRLAKRRAKEDGLRDRVSIKNADAADLPFAAESFDAVGHSDLLCCLVRKNTVLQECRRVVCKRGRMAFTVISIAPDLSRTQRARAIANAPEFVETEADYRSLLESTGWRLEKWNDLTEDYAQSCARQIEADTSRQDQLAELLGSSEARERLAGWHSKLGAIRDGLFLRELFVCRPS